MKEILLLNNFLPIVDMCLGWEDMARQSCAMVPRWRFLASFFRYMLSPVRLSVVCLSVSRLSSVTFVRPTQAVQIFDNIFTALGTLAIH